MQINIPLKEPVKEEVFIMTARDGGSMYLKSRTSDNVIDICWINNQIGSSYRGKLFKPYNGSRELFSVKPDELQDFVQTVKSYLNKVEETNEHTITKKAAFEREIGKLSENCATYYTPTSGN